MMLKVNGEYLDFNGDIEIEKKIKLFEDIDTADGDLSFAFDINLTSNNLRILGIPVPDSISKIIYQNIDCVVQNDSGVTINNGSLRVESSGIVASCSFLGGNSNWFAMLDGNMTELDLSRYDTELNEANIISSWTQTYGIVFPMIDLGALVTRGSNCAKTEDFLGCFYLHTLFKEVFQQSGIKIQGDLLNDSLYNQILICANTRSQNDVNNNSLFIGKNTPESIPLLGTYIIEYNQTTYPFHIGPSIELISDTDIYFSSKMNIEVVTFTRTSGGGFPSLPIPIINGSGPTNVLDTYSSFSGLDATVTFIIAVEAGDYLNIRLDNVLGVGTTTLVEATLKITPEFMYSTFGSSSVPLWTKRQFVSNVMQAFNVIPTYNQFTKTVTLDLFDKIKTKQSIDINEYITVNGIDYSDFISNYAKVNNFSYQEGSDEDLGKYNISSFVKYAAGTIESDNYFTDDSVDVIDLDFSTPISYVSSAFGGSIDRINFVELIDRDPREITSVTNFGGVPRFNITNADDWFEVNNLVRIDTDEDTYNGDYVVISVTSTYITVMGLSYAGSATGTSSRLFHSLTNDDSVYWFINIPLTDSNDIFGTDGNYLNQTKYGNWSIAFFSLIALGHQIENEYKQGLTFGEINSPSFFQKTLLDKYWKQFSRILNDPVKLITTAHLPWKVYNSIDFLSPISITTLETSNLYYVNRIVGYKDSSIGCEVDLIKLP